RVARGGGAGVRLLLKPVLGCVGLSFGLGFARGERTGEQRQGGGDGQAHGRVLLGKSVFHLQPVGQALVPARLPPKPGAGRSPPLREYQPPRPSRPSTALLTRMFTATR